MPAPIEISSISSIWLKNQIKQININAKNALIDFNVGFIVTAILALFFLALGALVLHGSAYEFKDGIAFSHQLVSMYTSVIGDWTIFISIIGFLIIIYFASSMRTMLDFAMILSFTTTPIFAFLNYKLARSTKLPKELQNGMFLNILSICGLIFLFGFLILFIIYRWFPSILGI